MFCNRILICIFLGIPALVLAKPSLKKQVQELNIEREQTLNQVEHQSKILEKIEQRLAKESEQLRIFQTQLQQGQQHLQQLLGQSERLRPRYAEHFHHLGLQLLLQHQHKHSLLQFLLTMEHPRQFSRKLSYYRYLNQTRLAHCKKLTETLHALETEQQEIAQQQVLLTQLEHHATQSLARLNAEKENRSLLLKNLKSHLNEKTVFLEKLHQEEAALQTVVTKLKAPLSRSATKIEKPFHKLRQKLPMPLQPPYSLVKNQAAPYRGVLFQAPEGSEIKAVHGGKVVFADWIRGFGLLTIIDHGQGYMTLYGHLQTIYKKLGDALEAGDLLARVGQSGGQDQPGLYFEIRKDGKAQDPLTWLKQ